jgi:hypothetical protein
VCVQSLSWQIVASHPKMAHQKARFFRTILLCVAFALT